MVETVILVQLHNENNHLYCKFLEELAWRERKSGVSCGNYHLFLRKGSDTLRNETKQKKNKESFVYVCEYEPLCMCVLLHIDTYMCVCAYQMSSFIILHTIP